MKKLLTMILFSLLSLPLMSQTVEKVVYFYGETQETSYNGLQPYSGKMKVVFLSNGNLRVGSGNIYEPYYNTYAHGCQVGYSDCTTYKDTWTLGGYDATYLIIRNDFKVANRVCFSMYPGIWQLVWNSTTRYVAKENNRSLGL